MSNSSSCTIKVATLKAGEELTVIFDQEDNSIEFQIPAGDVTFTTKVSACTAESIYAKIKAFQSVHVYGSVVGQEMTEDVAQAPRHLTRTVSAYGQGELPQEARSESANVLGGQNDARCEPDDCGPG